jgi:hypothetical protein
VSQNNSIPYLNAIKIKLDNNFQKKTLKILTLPYTNENTIFTANEVKMIGQD